MTDSSILATQNALPPLDTSLPPSASYPPPSPAVLTNGHSVPEDGDAEEGLIKCICTNLEDDGSTVMCDKCETWQHNICYYAGRDPPGENDPHFCVECQPRYLDRKAADERQKAARLLPAEDPIHERKKPGPKKTKKAKADGVNHTNGLSNGHGSPRNGTETSHKRKGRHQSSASTSNIPLKIPTSSKRASSSQVQSPLKSPASPPVPSDPNGSFSPEFMHLYKNDSGEDSMAVSQYEDIIVPTVLSDWVRTPAALARDTNGKTHDDIFIRKKGSFSDVPQVPWVKHRKEDRNIVAHGLNPQWIYITAEKDVGKDSFVGELIGKIGFMQAYTQDPTNRWEFLRHPLPFVFFHPQLPIVIDTREEGSVFRYVRRSCEPNLTMKTILEEVNDYHFCLTATREIKAGTELTIPWTLDEHVRRYFAKVEADVDEEYVSNYTRRVLAEFGGCACNDPTRCPMAQWAGWTKDFAHKSHKGRKKPQRGFGSRSSSEAMKQADDDELEDATAASNSSRSKPQSRDNTPSSLVDAKNILGEPISEREKRKIEALEKLEQSKQPERKKAKRKSADQRQGNPPLTPGLSKRGSIPDHDADSLITEVGLRSGIKTSPSPLQSGNGVAVPPPLKPVYSEAGCQADLDCSSLTKSLPSPTRPSAKRPMSSLHRNVFRRSVLKSETESPKVSSLDSPAVDKPGSPPIDSKSEPSNPSEPQKQDGEGDVKMSDGQETGLGIHGAKLDHEPKVEQLCEPQVAAAPDDHPNPSTSDMKPPPAPPNPDPTPNGADKAEENRNGELSPAISTSDLNVKGMNGPEPMESPKEKNLPAPTLAPHLAREVEAATATPSPAKKKKINFSQYLARRNSSNVPNSDANDNDAGRDNLSAGGSEEASRSLSPLREEARENGNEGNALETPKTENGDPMVTT